MTASSASQLPRKSGIRTSTRISGTRSRSARMVAAHFAATIRALRDRVPDIRVEVLIPDFRGNWDALDAVIDARPDVLNHNTETVPRLYKRVRPGARYERTLELLSLIHI